MLSEHVVAHVVGEDHGEDDVAASWVMSAALRQHVRHNMCDIMLRQHVRQHIG